MSNWRARYYIHIRGWSKKPMRLHTCSYTVPVFCFEDFIPDGGMTTGPIANFVGCSSCSNVEHGAVDCVLVNH